MEFAADPKIPSTWDTRARVSKVTIPERCNPLARVVFGEMHAQGVTYFEMESRAGVLASTIKSWRNEKNPGLLALTAVYGALGLSLVPVPRLDMLPADLRANLDEIAAEFASSTQALGAVISAAAEWPAFAAHTQAREYKSPETSARRRKM